MNAQFEAAYEIHQFLTAKKISYAVIGGLAVQEWGQPRFTSDVDVTILAVSGREEEVIAELLQTPPGRILDAAEFARKNRVLLASSKSGCAIDISLGVPGYEEQVVAHACDYDIGDGKKIKLCSAEDLVIHKAVAGRPQDCLDIEGIILRQGKRLDTGYIRRWLKNFSEIMEAKEILEHFTKPWNELLA